MERDYDYVFGDYVFPFCDLTDDQLELVFFRPRFSVAPNGSRLKFCGQWYPEEEDEGLARRLWGVYYDMLKGH